MRYIPTGYDPYGDNGGNGGMEGDPRLKKMFQQQSDPYSMPPGVPTAQFPTAQFDPAEPMNFQPWTQNTAKEPQTGGIKSPPGSSVSNYYGDPAEGGMQTASLGDTTKSGGILGGMKGFGKDILGGIKSIGA